MSSAYRIDLLWLRHLGKSFIYIRKRRGPRILPCETPTVIGLGLNVELLTVVT